MDFLRIIFCLTLWSFGALAKEGLPVSVEEPASRAAGTQAPVGGVSENSMKNLQKKGNDYFYNEGIQLLKTGQEQSALPFLQKSFYQYLFFPAYRILTHLGHPPSLWPFLWQVLALLYGTFSLIWFVFLLKKTASAPTPFLLKGVILWVSGLAILTFMGFFSLQKRAGALAEIKGYSAPFAESAVLWTAPEGSDVKILKTGYGWVQAQTDTGQKGWVETHNLLLTLE